MHCGLNRQRVPYPPCCSCWCLRGAIYQERKQSGLLLCPGRAGHVCPEPDDDGARLPVGTVVCDRSENSETAIAMECGLQNGTLAIAIAVLLFGGGLATVPATTYSLTMFVTALIYVRAVAAQAGRSRLIYASIHRHVIFRRLWFPSHATMCTLCARSILQFTRCKTWGQRLIRTERHILETCGPWYRSPLENLHANHHPA